MTHEIEWVCPSSCVAGSSKSNRCEASALAQHKTQTNPTRDDEVLVRYRYCRHHPIGHRSSPPDISVWCLCISALSPFLIVLASAYVAPNNSNAGVQLAENVRRCILLLGERQHRMALRHSQLVMDVTSVELGICLRHWSRLCRHLPTKVCITCCTCRFCRFTRQPHRAAAAAIL